MFNLFEILQQNKNSMEERGKGVAIEKNKYKASQRQKRVKNLYDNVKVLQKCS